MHQYLALCQRIIDEGVWIDNQRTGKKCLTVINADLQYDVAGNKCSDRYHPQELLESRHCPDCWVTCVATTTPRTFVRSGAKSWDANANQSEAWLANPVPPG